MRERVGGSFWGDQPALPAGAILVRSPRGLSAAIETSAGRPVVIWSGRDQDAASVGQTVGDNSDAWHVLESAERLVCDRADPIALIAAIKGVPIQIIEPDGRLSNDDRTAARLVEQVFPVGVGYACPFTGRSLTIVEAIELCGFWRRLIDSNRDIAGGYGFAFWKKQAVAPLLWNGSEPFRFFSTAAEAGPGSPVAIWRARTPRSIVAELEAAGTLLVEVEDGFLRSRGLGADCVPPLSIVVDRLGPYFDPGQPSELETLLQEGQFDEALIERAAALRRRIIDAGLGKYESGSETAPRFGGDRRHILIPGQVEDDRSVLTGGAGLESNMELLRQVRAAAPDAYLIYKPHPDVLAGHRKGSAQDSEALEHADRIVTDLPIAALIDMADEVHVNTSLTGFEALLRGKPVTTHGVPFYAGWGLTTDLGPVPGRRTARRPIDELVAAALLVYPRYLDPVTGLPCPAEIAVDRLTETQADRVDLLVALRRLQGRLMKGFRSLAR
ncbi:MAG TPA: hypothetical protein VFK50_04285 [Sphingomicrobium sp.]|nr:hypothetical protein [Sphingomicrobium sp.]